MGDMGTFAPQMIQNLSHSRPDRLAREVLVWGSVWGFGDEAGSIHGRPSRALLPVSGCSKFSRPLSIALKSHVWRCSMTQQPQEQLLAMHIWNEQHGAFEWEPYKSDLSQMYKEMCPLSCVVVNVFRIYAVDQGRTFWGMSETKVEVFVFNRNIFWTPVVFIFLVSWTVFLGI